MKTDYYQFELLCYGSLTPHSFKSLIFYDIETNPMASYEDLTKALGKGRSIIMRNIQNLKDAGVLLRVGSKKTGTWKVIDTK